tara:strand:- start:37 stop:1215 length:1179 start_codon:yes stop_codon:yes gene_type:complete
MYIKYYIISVISIFVSILTFFISKKIKSYFFISIVSLISTLYLFEIYSKFKLSNLETEKLKIREKLKNFDNRSIHEVLSSAREKGLEVYYPVFPFLFLEEKNIKLYPLTGRSNTDLIYCNENGFFTKFSSDRYGFNNPDNVWEQQSVEYLILGDSYAYGNCVNRPNDVSSVLRKISKKNSINLGQSGIGPLIEYAILREYYPNNVKKVIWLYYEGNDIGDLMFELRNDFLIKYITKKNFSQNLKSKQNDINRIVEKKDLNRVQAKTKEKFVGLKEFIKLKNLRTQIFPNKVKIPSEFEKILKLTQNLTQKNQSELVFVYLPEYSRLNKNFKNENYNKVKSIVKKLNIKFIDANEELLKKDNPRKFWPQYLEGGHFSEKGYSELARLIFDQTN